MAKLIPSIYTSRGKVGDFEYMIEQPDYNDALFIFNDDELMFLTQSLSRGGGNAVIRPYKGANPPKSAGIPTGTGRGGYQELTSDVMDIIDSSLSVISKLIHTGKYKRVFYSAEDSSGRLGTSIFHVSEDVKKYIIQELNEVIHKYNRIFAYNV
jgi:hypothetical protein